MKQRTEQYKHNRATDAAGDNFAHQLVSSASNSVFLRSTPLSAFGSPDADATQYPPLTDNVEDELEQHWIQYENPAQFDKLLYASFGQVTAGSASSWSRVQPNLVDFTRIVAIRDFLKDAFMQEDLDALEKWIRLVGERLNVPVEPYILQDARSAKRSRRSQEPVRVVPESLESAYLQKMPLVIEKVFTLNKDLHTCNHSTCIVCTLTLHATTLHTLTHMH